MSLDEKNANGFPQTGILPKVETQALQFVRKYPDYDGKGVIVAIMDTGVDPGAIGLQKTSDGKPKVIDIVDTTGSGDLDTSTIVEGKIEGDYVTIKSISGKQLKLSKDWTNPSGKWHVGVKPEFDLYPNGLKKRVKGELKKKFLENQKKREAKLARKIAELKGCKSVGSSDDNKSSDDKKSEPKPDLDDLQAQLECLRSLMGTYDPPGRIFDVVVFNDGKNWRAVVDTKCDGDLSGAKPMADYRLEHQYGTFSSLDLMNYSVNIYDNGNLVSIVVTCGSHGTHVAGIVAANFPESSENVSMNGVAPGAQIVSIKIGDTRLGSMETNTGMCRAIQAILRNKCDLVNMSYGEPTSTPNKGYFVELSAELVNNHGVIFVSSAGNAGPALSTVGAPGSTTTEIIGVGAYVSPGMMESEYAIRDVKSMKEVQYTWSSRGPTVNGHPGVCISAPGGAIAPVPQWVLQKNTLMNGTSMASPNACGGIALVLSALRTLGIKWTPHAVRRAVENTAKLVDGIECFALGYGLLQVSDCFNFLESNAKNAESAFAYSISVRGHAGLVATCSGGPTKGVYLRQAAEVIGVQDVSVSVKPSFHEDADKKIIQAFEQKIVIKATKFWVNAPKCVLMHSGGRSFSVQIDPTNLLPGPYYAEVLGMDATDLSKGPLFRVPITVCIPEKIQDKSGQRYNFEKIPFSSGKISRKFLAPPQGSTSVHIKFKPSGPIDTSRGFMVAAQWLTPQESPRATEINKFVYLKTGGEANYVLPVKGGHTLEVVLAQYWSSLGVCEIDLEVTFHGISTPPLVLPSDPAVTRADVTCWFGEETVEPKATLTHRHITYRPKSYNVQPLPAGYRDELPGGKSVYEIILTYNFDMDKKANCKVTFPTLNGKLYDSPFGSQLFMVFDELKYHVSSGDAWPDSKTIPKGKTTVRLHVRHDNTKLLLTLKSLPLVLERPLAKKLNVDTFGSYINALSKGGKFGKMRVTSGQTIPVFFKSPSTPSESKPGELLVGSYTLLKLPAGQTDPNAIPITLPVAPKPAKDPKPEPKAKAKTAKPKEAESKDAKEEQKEDETLKVLRKAAISAIDKLKGDKLKAALKSKAFAAIEEQYGYTREFVELKVRIFANLKEYEKVVECADKVVSMIDADKIAKYFGKKPTEEEKKTLGESMEKDRAALLSALVAKAKALMEIIKKANSGIGGLKGTPKETSDAFNKALDDYKQWADEKSNKKDLGLLQTFKILLQGHYGKALKAITDSLGANPLDKALMKQQTEIFISLGWTDWGLYAQTWASLKAPAKFRCF